MGYLEHKELSPRQIDVAVITVSDSRTLDTMNQVSSLSTVSKKAATVSGNI